MTATALVTELRTREKRSSASVTGRKRCRGTLPTQFLLERALFAGCGFDEADIAHRKLVEHAGRQHEGEVDAAGTPGEIAQVRNAGGDGFPEDVQGHHVADFQAKRLGDLVEDRDQWFAGVVLGPPSSPAGNDGRARRQRAGRGQRDLTSKASRNSSGMGGSSDEGTPLTEAMAPRRNGMASKFSMRGSVLANSVRPATSCLEEVEVDEARGLGDQFLVELMAQVVVDQSDRRQQGKAGGRREDHGRGEHTGR